MLNYTTPAARRGARRAVPFVILYFVLLFGVVTLLERHAVSGPGRYLLALLPALPLVGVILVLGRYLLEEQDEYVRWLKVRVMLIATAFMLVVTTMWGFLEAFADVPHVPAYFAFVLWSLGVGVATCWFKFRP